ncbi:MAG: glycosyltransferase [Betaproteobacteria bacterium]
MSEEQSLLSQRAELPLVSVIMNCLNSAKYLREAIDSVFAQTYGNWEIVFWDNVSIDDSAAIAQSYNVERMRYFRGETTVPLGHARNLAIAKSRGEFIAFLDCDDVWLPEKLEMQVPLFLADADVGLVYSDTYFFNEDGFQRRLYADKKPYRGHCFPDLLNNYLISLETAVVRKSAIDSMDHWFDVSFNMVEECDLFVRIGLGWKIDFSPNVLAKWRVHGESLSWTKRDSFVTETRRMLDKLQAIPKIKNEYQRDMTLAWYAQSLSEAKMLWKNGDGAAARRIILNLPNHGLKSCLLWIGSFLPFAASEFLYRLMRRSVTPAS